MNGYLYKTTHAPTGYLYFGSRKTPEGIAPSADSYMGSPCGSNKMLELFNTCPSSEFTKEVLTVLPYEEVLDLENLLITEAWEKFGKAHEGGLVTNLVSGRVYIYTNEVKAKIGASSVGRQAFLGRSHSTAAKEKISLNHANVSGQNNPFFGKTHTPETVAKIRAANVGREVTVERREMLSKASPNCKTVINTATGETWHSRGAAAKALGITRASMKWRIQNGSFGGIWRYV